MRNESVRNFHVIEIFLNQNDNQAENLRGSRADRDSIQLQFK